MAVVEWCLSLQPIRSPKSNHNPGNPKITKFTQSLRRRLFEYILRFFCEIAKIGIAKNPPHHVRFAAALDDAPQRALDDVQQVVVDPEPDQRDDWERHRVLGGVRYELTRLKAAKV